ncbi:MAG: tetratricopeptide repeat protein [Chitinispirillaceae bacterium]|jgi:tetratricopeptide (TPR) repeat protein
MKRSLFAIGTFFIVAGHAAAGVQTKDRLDTCVSYYRDGDYQKAADSIKALLPLIADKREEAEAYKYLGFSYVMLDRTDKAKEYFGVAIEKFPQMTIDTLEVPPNISNVFKQVRAETQAGAGERKVQGKKGGRVALASLMTATGAIGVGAGVFFFHKAYRAHRDYENTINDFDPPWVRMRNNVILGSCVTALAAADLYFGLRLFLKKPATPATPASPASQKIGMVVSGDRVALSIDF